MSVGDLLKKTGNQDPFAERKSPVHLPVITCANESMSYLMVVSVLSFPAIFYRYLALFLVSACWQP